MRNPCALVVGIQIGVNTMENRWRVLKKLKIELPKTKWMQQFHFWIVIQNR